jgi:hypothetical protein
MEWWEFFLVLIVVMPIVTLWISCLIDIIMRPDLSGWSKAAWMLGVIFFPLFGAIIYVIVRPPLASGLTSPDPALVRDMASPDPTLQIDPGSLPNPR